MNLNELKIREMLFIKRTSQTELAKRSGVSRVTVSAVCNGKSCNDATAQRIAHALGVDLTEIAR